MNALLFGFGAAFGLAAWRNVAPLDPAPARGAVVVWLLVALALAYWCGRSRRRFGATATATATATAQAVATGGSAAIHLHLDQLTGAPWRGQQLGQLEPRYVLAAQQLDELEGLDDLDPVELIELTEGSTSRHVAAQVSRHTA